MKRQFGILGALGCVALLGFFASLDLSAGLGLQEVKNAIAEELVGGACAKYGTVACNPPPNTKCPFQVLFKQFTDGEYPNRSGVDLVTCGCIKKPRTGCTTQKAYLKITYCAT